VRIIIFLVLFLFTTYIILWISGHKLRDIFCGDNFYFKFETPTISATRLEPSSHCFFCFAAGRPSAPWFPCRYLNIHPYASSGQSPLLWGGPPAHQPFYREALGMLACMHTVYSWTPCPHRHELSHPSNNTALLFFLRFSQHTRTLPDLRSDSTGCQHLLAQVVLVLPNRAVPWLDGLVFANQNLLCNLVQQPITEGQLRVTPAP
jgi:hypothetical protein